MKLNGLEGLLEAGYEIFITTLPENFGEFTVGPELKPYTNFFNAMNSDKVVESFELNCNTYGPLEMTPPKWNFGNFFVSTGAEIGFIKESELVAVTTLISQYNGKGLHFWNFFVTYNPVKSIGLGKMLYALIMELNQNKEKVSCIVQADNAAILSYLHTPNPLKIKAAGFFHKHKNSFLVEVKVFKNGFEEVMKPLGMPLLEEALEMENELQAGSLYKIWADNIAGVQKIGNEIANGSEFEIKAWYAKPSPVMLVKKVA